VPVGFCMERGPEMAVVLLGILKAGGAYVPLDPGYPPERLALMVGEIGAPLLLAQDSLVGRLPADSGAVSIDAVSPEALAPRCGWRSPCSAVRRSWWRSWRY